MRNIPGDPRRPASGTENEPPTPRGKAAAGVPPDAPDPFKLKMIKYADAVPQLEAAARRAEDAHERAEKRRKAGGSFDPNVALRTTDNGRRWERNLRLGLLGAVCFAVLLVGMLYYRAGGIKPVPVRQMKERARQMVLELAALAEKFEPFAENEHVTASEVSARLRKMIDVELAVANEQVKSSQGRQKEYLLKQQEQLRNLSRLKDPLGNAIVFTLEDQHTLWISLAGNFGGGEAPFAQSVPLRRGSGTLRP